MLTKYNGALQVIVLIILVNLWELRMLDVSRRRASFHDAGRSTIELAGVGEVRGSSGVDCPFGHNNLGYNWHGLV